VFGGAARPVMALARCGGQTRGLADGPNGKVRVGALSGRRLAVDPGQDSLVPAARLPSLPHGIGFSPRLTKRF